MAKVLAPHKDLKSIISFFDRLTVKRVLDYARSAPRGLEDCIITPAHGLSGPLSRDLQYFRCDTPSGVGMNILACGSDKRPVKLPKLDQIRGPL